VLTLFYINDEFIQNKKGGNNFSREEELLGFIKAHKENQAMYEKAVVLNRIK
jgi:hypothetical protein